jgi:hypothetical protein
MFFEEVEDARLDHAGQNSSPPANDFTGGLAPRSGDGKDVDCDSSFSIRSRNSRRSVRM